MNTESINRAAVNAYCRAQRAKNLEAYRARERRYYADNKEAIQAYGKEYYKKNKTAIRAKRKEYYQKNKDARKAYGREYYRNNREFCKAGSRRWREANRGKYNETQLQNRFLHAKENAAEARVFREWRKSECLSQAAVGKMLGVGRAAISLYEQGKCKTLPYDKYMTIPSFAAWMANNKEE